MVNVYQNMYLTWKRCDILMDRLMSHNLMIHIINPSTFPDILKNYYDSLNLPFQNFIEIQDALKQRKFSSIDGFINSVTQYINCFSVLSENPDFKGKFDTASQCIILIFAEINTSLQPLIKILSQNINTIIAKRYRLKIRQKQKFLNNRVYHFSDAYVNQISMYNKTRSLPGKINPV